MPPPTKGLTTKDLNLGSEGSESDSGSSSSDSSSDSDSDSGSDSESQQKKKSKHEKKIESPAKTEVKPKKKVDEVRPFATCKHCHGNMNQNKIGVPELMLHCTKCNQSSHPSCVGLHLELLQFVTNYDWESLAEQIEDPLESVGFVHASSLPNVLELRKPRTDSFALDARKGPWRSTLLEAGRRSHVSNRLPETVLLAPP